MFQSHGCGCRVELPARPGADRGRAVVRSPVHRAPIKEFAVDQGQTVVVWRSKHDHMPLIDAREGHERGTSGAREGGTRGGAGGLAGGGAGAADVPGAFGA
ncbi:hypothetical protein GCM10023263_46930 [Phytohabitans rumicis]